MSSGYSGSARVTGAALSSVLDPSVSASTFETAHFVLRKLGHVVAYGVLAWLFFRALRGLWLTAGVVLIIAIADEMIQSQVASRSGSPYDVVLDVASALATLVILRLRS